MSSNFPSTDERPLSMILAAFHKGDERHNEFSIHVQTEGGWVVS